MSNAPLSFGIIGPPWAGEYPLSRKNWTRIGLLSIPLWATWPALAIRTFQIPPLESLAIVFLIAWLVLTRIKEPGLGDVGRFWSIRAWFPAVVFAAGISGSDISFLLASRLIPAPQANLISYLWPVMIVVFGAAVGLFRPHLRQFAGLFVGFVGTVILVWDGHVSMSIAGIGLALLSGACWAGYCVFRLLWKGAAEYVLARGCAISTVLCASLHFAVERTVVPGVGALGAAVLAGIIPLGLGNFLWDQGFRRGDGELLAVMAYATPLCSALLLTALGAASLTWSLLIGAILIVSAGFLSHTAACESIKPQVNPGRVGRRDLLRAAAAGVVVAAAGTSVDARPVDRAADGGGSMGAGIRAFKLYTGPDHASHVLEGTIDEKDRTDVIAIHFKETPAHSSEDWHASPERQYVITLSGTLEFTTRGGEIFVVRPGDVLLSEDTLSTGHKWRLMDDQPWRRAYVILKPGAKDSFVAKTGGR